MKGFKILLLACLCCCLSQALADNRQHFKNIINVHGMPAGTGVVTAIAVGQAEVVIAPGEVKHRENFPWYYQTGSIVINGSTGAKVALPQNCTTARVAPGSTLIFQGDIYPDKAPSLKCSLE